MPTWIKYIIPEDGDDFDHPNIFKIEDKSEYKVSEITKVSRHFRKVMEYPFFMCLFFSDRAFLFPVNFISAFYKMLVIMLCGWMLWMKTVVHLLLAMKSLLKRTELVFLHHLILVVHRSQILLAKTKSTALFYTVVLFRS
jgi:hypothetical protein